MPVIDAAYPASPLAHTLARSSPAERIALNRNVALIADLRCEGNVYIPSQGDSHAYIRTTKPNFWFFHDSNAIDTSGEIDKALIQSRFIESRYHLVAQGSCMCIADLELLQSSKSMERAH